MLPGETPELRARDRLRIEPPGSPDAPSDIRTAPRAQPVTPRQAPEYPEHALPEGMRALRRHSRLVRSGIVTAARMRSRLPRRVHHHLDLPERAVQSRVGGRVLDGVLVADIVSHPLRDAVHLRKVLGEKRFA